MAKYTAREIFQHVLNIEDAGEKFYNALAAGIDHEPLKKVFLHMAGQEGRHRETYRAFMEAVGDGPAEKRSEAADGSFDERQYEELKDKIFNRMESIKKIARLKTLGDALNYMIDIECAAVDLFEQLQHLVNQAERPQITRIINEERSHVKQLVDLRQRFENVNIKAMSAA